MLNKFLNKPILVLSVVIFLLLASIPFQKNIDSQRNRFRSIEETLYLSSSTLKKVSLGFDEILSDIYWFRALQYFGNPEVKHSKKDSDLLLNYFDIITDLDPKFVNAYRFGGTFLAEPAPFGLSDVDKGIQLLDKGRENNPDNFRIPFEQGFIYYLYAKDFEKAAELFTEASEKPNLSEVRKASIKGMAATAGTRGGDRELSKKIWAEIYNNTNDEGRKNFAIQNLKELQTQDFEDKLSDLADEYKEKNGNYPKNLNDLLIEGYIKKIPKDHGDQEFFITKNSDGIKSMTLSKKILDENIIYLNVKSKNYKSAYKEFPKNMTVLKQYIDEQAKRDYPVHPLDENYIYNPETGVVDYDNYFLQ